MLEYTSNTVKRSVKAIVNALFLVLCISLTIYFVMRGEDFSTLLAYLESSSQVYWIIGMVLVIAFILCESLIIFYMLRNLGCEPKLTHCFLYSFIGFFFSLVTPTGSGGQPMQLVYMKKDGLPLSMSTLVLLFITITYKSVLVLIGLFLVVARPEAMMVLLEPAMFWIILGIVLNVIVVGCMLALVFSPKLAKRIVMWAIRVMRRISHSEKIDRLEEKAHESMEKYAEASKYLKAHKLVSLNVMLITIVQRFLLFSVTYLVFLSFDITSLDLFQTSMLQGSISLAADMLPLPGGVGISEHLFAVIFGPVCGTELTIPAMIISRGLSFYAQLFVCAVMSLVAHVLIMMRKSGKREN